MPRAILVLLDIMTLIMADKMLGLHVKVNGDTTFGLTSEHLENNWSQINDLGMGENHSLGYL